MNDSLASSAVCVQQVKMYDDLCLPNLDDDVMFEVKKVIKLFLPVFLELLWALTVVVNAYFQHWSECKTKQRIEAKQTKLQLKALSLGLR